MLAFFQGDAIYISEVFHHQQIDNWHDKRENKDQADDGKAKLRPNHEHRGQILLQHQHHIGRQQQGMKDDSNDFRCALHLI